MNGLITTREDFNLEEELERIRAYKVEGVVRKVSCKETGRNFFGIELNEEYYNVCIKRLYDK